MRTLKLPSSSENPTHNNEQIKPPVLIEIEESKTSIEEDLHPANVESLVLRCAECFSKLSYYGLFY